MRKEVYLKKLIILNQNGENLVNNILHPIERMAQNAKKSP